MKTTLEATLKLAKINMITDINIVEAVTFDFLTTPYDKFECSLKHFKEIRLGFTNIELDICKGSDGEFLCKTTFGDILGCSEEFYGSSRYLYLQHIALGITAVQNIFQVRKFCLLSLSSYMQYYNSSDLELMSNMVKKFLDLTLDITIGELMNKIKRVITRPWCVDSDIEEYRDRILGCGKILDFLLVKNLKEKYSDFY